MSKNPLSIFSGILLAMMITIAIAYTVKQFDNVEHRLRDTTETVFFKAVEASYDIIDTTVNESLRNYLRGIIFSIENIIEVSSEEELNLDNENVKKTLDALTEQARIGKNGYITIISPKGVLTSHPYMKDQDVSSLNIIQKQLRSSPIFIEYPWKNPNDKKIRLKVAYSKRLPNGSIISASVYKTEMLNLVDKDLLKSKLIHYNFGKTGYVYVVDSNGMLILHPTNEGQSIRSLIGNSTDQFMAHVKEHPSGTFSYPLSMEDGHKEIKTVAYKYYPYLDWIIASGISRNELTQSTDQLLHSLLMALFCLLLVIFSLVLLLSSRHKRMLLIEKKDFLTGLHNRRSLVEYVEERKNPSIYSVILFDIDHFKDINDNFGHSEGDKAIIATAQVLKSLESRRIIVSRHGGEEFLVFLDGVKQNQAYLLAEIIRQRVASLTHLKAKFTISAGVYETQTKSEDIDDAISHADHALYTAKQSGRNKVVIYQNE